MERRPTTCPICGSKITRVTNAVTKNSYFKCSNNDCYFVLGEEYTEAELKLQGTRLSTGCLKCKEKLTVVNGPRGLFAKCLNCDCDSVPVTYNSKTYNKWVNAHRDIVKKEIEALIEAFNSKENEEDSLFDFDTFIAQPLKTPEKEVNKKASEISSYAIRILELITKVNAPIDAKIISENTGIGLNATRMTLSNLKKEGLIKIVGYKVPEGSGNCPLLYQTIESTLPELKLYKEEEGYTSISSFAKKHKENFSANTLRKKLDKALKNQNIKNYPLNSTKGVCLGYKVSDLEKLLGTKPTSIPASTPVIKHKKSSRKSKSILEDSIIEILQEDLNHPYSSNELKRIILKNIDISYNNISHRVNRTIAKLKDEKKVKVVGWEVNRESSVTLKYQLAASPLSKIKITTDSNLYTTFEKFYKKRLMGKVKKHGFRQEAYKKVKGLSKTPLILNQRAYIGYLKSDLNKAFSNDLNLSSTKIKVKKIKRIPNIPDEIQAAVITRRESGKDKGFLGVFSSLFNKKEKSSINC